ncbi:amidase [Agarivorans sp. QJM3NY_25]|uniref:amidase n=1 Tax=Agarivorans sp. QJM3NY_25 TaxID=3421430 RepID=UPI003D7E566E
MRKQALGIAIAAILFGGNVYAVENVENYTVTEIINDIKHKKVTAVELVQAYMARIDKIESSKKGFNAILTQNPDVIEEAKALDKLNDKSSLSLAGVPIFVKDNINTSNMPTSHGNEALKEYQPAHNAVAVDRLIKAGALIMGKTNMAEFAMFWDTLSSAGGRTYNPQDRTKNINGSSGGSAASVVAGYAPVALGTESCGSITDVASFTSLVGYRPSPGIVPTTGMDYNTLGDTIGPLAKNVIDAATVVDVMAGEDQKDALTHGHALTETLVHSLNDNKSLKGKVLGYVVAPFGGWTAEIAITPEISATMQKALDELRAQGAIIQAIHISSDWWTEYGSGSYWDATGKEDYFVRTEAKIPKGLKEQTEPFDVLNYGDLIAKSPKMNAITKDWLSYSDNKPLDPKTFNEAVESRVKFSKGVDKIYKEYGLDALIYPTVSLPPAEVEDPETLIDPNQLGTHCGWANFTGRPVISVPAGFSNNFPVGLSFLGKRFKDGKLLGMAAAFEESTTHQKLPVL